MLKLLLKHTIFEIAINTMFDTMIWNLVMSQPIKMKRSELANVALKHSQDLLKFITDHPEMDIDGELKRRVESTIKTIHDEYE